jgi:hypothetical protein
MESIRDSVDELDRRVARVKKFRRGSTEAVGDQGDKSDGTQHEEDGAEKSEADQDGTVSEAD